MGTTLKVKLSTKSFKKAAQEIMKYSDSLHVKTEKYVEALRGSGINALTARINNISPFYKGENLSVSDEIIQGDNGWSARIILSGSQAAFIEFGAGVTFNTGKGGSLHPKGQDLGMTIGSYNPTSPNATNPKGWFYKDKWGEYQHTYGTPTFAPLYKTSEELFQKAREIAINVFKTNVVIEC